MSIYLESDGIPELEEIAKHVTPSEVDKIVAVLVKAGAVLPITVVAAGFRDIIDGEMKGGIPEGQRTKYDDIRAAAFSYLFLKHFGSKGSGRNIAILKKEHMIDANGSEFSPE